jgi:heme-degrading monooxygenase HmoA
MRAVREAMLVMPVRPPARAKLIAMIGRLWSGRTEPADAAAYEAFLRDELLPDVATLEGARGAYVLRRETLDGAVEFVTLTLFDSLDAVRGFAGQDVERAVIEPRAQELLAEYDAEVRHFDVVVAPSDRP